MKLISVLLSTLFATSMVHALTPQEAKTNFISGQYFAGKSETGLACHVVVKDIDLSYLGAAHEGKSVEVVAWLDDGQNGSILATPTDFTLVNGKYEPVADTGGGLCTDSVMMGTRDPQAKVSQSTVEGLTKTERVCDGKHVNIKTEIYAAEDLSAVVAFSTKEEGKNPFFPFSPWEKTSDFTCGDLTKQFSF